MTDIFEYVGDANPQGSFDLFRRHSGHRISKDQIGDGLRSVFKSLPESDQEKFLVEMAEIHPDGELLSTVYGDESDFSDDYTKSGKCHCQHCQIANSHATGSNMVGANGIDAVNHYMSSGDVKNIVNDTANGLNEELKTLKTENSFKALLNDKIFKLITLGVLAFLVIKITSKK